MVMIEPWRGRFRNQNSGCRLVVSRSGLTSPPAPFRVGIAPTDSFPKTESVSERRDKSAYPRRILSEQPANGAHQGANHHAIRQELVGMVAQKIRHTHRRQAAGRADH